MFEARRHLKIESCLAKRACAKVQFEKEYEKKGESKEEKVISREREKEKYLCAYSHIK